jgi:hypothetical protein
MHCSNTNTATADTATSAYVCIGLPTSQLRWLHYGWLQGWWRLVVRRLLYMHCSNTNTSADATNAATCDMRR